MCGIAGRINLDKSTVDRGYAAEMLRLLRHRGPDDCDTVFIDTATREMKSARSADAGDGALGNAFLAHTRLSIIDLSSGSQPMTDTSGKYTIVFNGEIYNYIELRAELISRGHEFKTRADTEVILNAYKEFGEDCVNHLNGMFAFALYDSARNIVFCARDRIGIKPFYYYQDADKFIFASEIKAILCHNDIDKEIDFGGMADYLTFLYTTRGKTFHKKIKSLIPGHTITIGAGGILIRRYWTPDLEPDYSMTEKYAVENLRWLVEDAVRIHMRSDVQIGAHLSGGVDSSAIVCLIAKYYDRPLFTFTGRFDEGGLYDESQYALAVAAEVGAKAHLITPSADEFAQNMAAIARSMDYPEVGPGVFPQYIVSKSAGSILKVVLGGQGSDELFLGYPRYIRSLIESKLLNRKTEPCLDDQRLGRLIYHYIRSYSVPGLAGWGIKRRFSDFDRRYIMTSAPLYGFHKYFTGDLARQLALHSPIDEEVERFRAIESSSLTNKMSWYDLSNYLVALLHVEDRTSMAWSLESRVPLLDHRIVEFGFKIPPSLKLKNLEPKYILKKAVEHVLPEIIRKRTDKKGFPTPVDIWFNGELKSYADGFVTPDILARRNIYNSHTIGRYAKGRRRFLTPALRRETLMWAMINMELWFRTFKDVEIPNLIDTKNVVPGIHAR